MQLYTLIARNIFLPLEDMVMGTSILKHLKFLEKSQWWSHEELKEYQNKKLKVLIRYAYENVPYYHREWKKLNLRPEDIKTVEDLRKIPIITKEDIRKNISDLKSNDFEKRKPKLSITSGSTGEPLKYYTTWNSWTAEWACSFRGWEFADYQYGDKQVVLGGSSIIPINISWKKKMRASLERNLLLSSYNMDRDMLKEYVKGIKNFNPKFIRGYPSAIYLLTKYLEEKNIELAQPVAIFTHSEKLIPFQRRVIENYFGNKVFDGYGCMDGGASAMECKEHDGYHISIERCVMEFVKDEDRVSAGERGEIVLTDLHNYAMPFIRYTPGDVGIYSDELCPCGRGLPLMKNIEGRTTDFMLRFNGTLIPALPLTDIFEDIELNSRGTFRRYQIIQETKEKIIVRIVKGPHFSQNAITEILRAVKGHLGKEIQIDIQFVDKIQYSKSGKEDFVRSKVTEKFFR
jgi:phenylacetate-CoA ligase